MNIRILRANTPLAYMVLLLVAVTISVSLFGSLFYAAEYVVQHLDKTLPAFSDAGQYLNFQIGIPLAIISTLIGVFVSLLFGQYTRTKDEVAILTFVDDVSKPVFKELNTIADAYYIVHRAADRVSDDVVELIDSLGDDAKDIDFDALIGQLNKEQIDNVGSFGKAIAHLWTSYQTLASSIHGAHFLKTKYAQMYDHTPVEYLRRKLPEGYIVEHISDNFKAIFNDLLRWIEITTGSDLLRAYAFIPMRYMALDFAGLVIYSPQLKLAEPITCGGLTIKGYVVNVGLSYLVTLYQILPDKNCMVTTFGKVFTKRSELAENFLNEAGPTISEMAIPIIDRAIRTTIESPNRLIIVLTDQGEQFYDPKIHGEIPQSKGKYVEE